VAVIPVAEDQTSAFGILKMDASGRIVHFDEKPPRERLPGLSSELPGGGPRYLASMGIYFFKRECSSRPSPTHSSSISAPRHPRRGARQRVQAYVYRGYWEDVGTIQSYFQANLALCDAIPPFDFYDAKRPVYTTRASCPRRSWKAATSTARWCRRAASCTAPRSSAPSSASAAASAPAS
jgi:glucose-1-phosphate adenylyltransferase